MFKQASAAVGHITNVASAYTWLSGGSALTSFLAAYNWWESNPRLSTFLLVLGIEAALIFIYALTFVPRPGTCWPPFWVGYLNPLRQVSWRFGCVLQVDKLPSVRTPIVYEFCCGLRANRGAIKPKRFYLEARGVPNVPVKIQCGPTFESAENIEEIPSGTWFLCSARLLRDYRAPDDGKTNHPTSEEFFQNYDELTLVFEYDEKIFKKRFRRATLLKIVQFGSERFAAPAPKQPKLKAAE
ncbi:hypothetical protein [Pseudorhodoplanes sp.]|uniref:hypothetical protein n=1 Tax=Pseudorhodoplanes sp. TaxID=1934341 RepID=UPI002BBA7C8A|nr:hypothetical protein [Pseudorhodoplanes sp.]HWV52419.1 hypothetical protein [Pseudorhodoplanes sp.]